MPEIIPNLHPVFVHFTVALFSLSTGLLVFLFLFKKHLSSSLQQQLKTVAFWNLWFGAVITLVTVAAGFYAYNTVAHDGPSHAAMTEHRNWALAAATLFVSVAIWSVFRVQAGKIVSGLFVTALLVAQLVLLSAAWHGGEVVYRYGLGVMSLPQSEGEGHAHSHGEGSAGHGHGDGDDQATKHEEMDFGGMDEMMEGGSDVHDHGH